jgi:hypothetical protein
MVLLSTKRVKLLAHSLMNIDETHFRSSRYLEGEEFMTLLERIVRGEIGMAILQVMKYNGL